jgi:hypothetical protein
VRSRKCRSSPRPRTVHWSRCSRHAPGTRSRRSACNRCSQSSIHCTRAPTSSRLKAAPKPRAKGPPSLRAFDARGRALYRNGDAPCESGAQPSARARQSGHLFPACEAVQQAPCRPCATGVARFATLASATSAARAEAPDSRASCTLASSRRSSHGSGSCSAGVPGRSGMEGARVSALSASASRASCCSMTARARARLAFVSWTGKRAPRRTSS